MQCPSCGSASCRRLEVIHDEGTQDIHTTSRSTGVAGGLVGGRAAFGVGGGTTTTSGVSRSRLAESAAPPLAKPVKNWVITAFIAFMVCGFAGSWSWKAGALVVVALCAYKIFDVAKWNSQKLPELQQQWRNTWMCGSCGETFMP